MLRGKTEFPPDGTLGTNGRAADVSTKNGLLFREGESEGKRGFHAAEIISTDETESAFEEFTRGNGF